LGRRSAAISGLRTAEECKEPQHSNIAIESASHGACELFPTVRLAKQLDILIGIIAQGEELL
jgi:hypothetical protein